MERRQRSLKAVVCCWIALLTTYLVGGVCRERTVPEIVQGGKHPLHMVGWSLYPLGRCSWMT